MYPNSLLGNQNKRKKYWNAMENEFFFDRHRTRLTNFNFFF